jgi:bifunctional UDP-N-acetylglucosamine pyrophosphorylase/glucosamine-1-phosphate N-acetyltransferase
MPSSSPVGIILAAGKGTRMKSDLPKALHQVGGLPMVEWIGRAMAEAGIERIVIVIGHHGEMVEKALGDRYEYVWQREQLGTGHAARMTEEVLGGHKGPVIVAPGDAPLLNAEVFRRLIAAHQDSVCTFATALVDDPKGYGRVLRDESGAPTRIVEEKDATPEQRAIKEVSAALYCFDGPSLYRELPKLRNDNAQGEHYLPDLIAMFSQSGRTVRAVLFEDERVLLGVNDRWQLAKAESEIRAELLRKHALNGVTLIDPATTTIGADVEIGEDTIVEPCTSLLGRTVIGTGCRIGPNTRIQDCRIGSKSRVLMSHAVRATLGDNVHCGPFANLRPGAILGDGVKVGNFVEIKNSVLETNVSASHLTYIGDADVGAETNIGAGTITCNYDGFTKSRTTIGRNVFVGSNATLVAPVTLGDGTMVAAGSTITRDVPENAGAFGRARQETKEGWAEKWRDKRR